MSQTSIATIRALYQRLADTGNRFRQRLGRPLTYAEKVLFLHLHDPEGCDLRNGGTVARLAFDTPVGTAEEARAALVTLVGEARKTG